VQRYKPAFPVLLDSDSSITRQYDPDLTFPLTLLISPEDRIEKVDNGYLPGELFSGHQKDFYAWQAELKLKSHVLRVFHGDSRGGMKCSGGVCKNVPAFGGTRVEAIIRFWGNAAALTLSGPGRRRCLR